MVFQRFNLFPHLTALQNIIEGPITVLKRPARDEAVSRGADLLDRVGLSRQARSLSDRSCPAASSSASPSPARWR
jgi:polar amino acid transport system ATP-binding protein